MYQEIQKKLATKLSRKRYEHSLRVSETATALAERFGADTDQARLAGLLHDSARDLPNNILLQMAQAFGIVMNDVEKIEPVLLHAPLGAKIAQVEYGVSDIAILQAISLHTTGGPYMALLDKIIYVADVIEPGRSFPGVDELRLLAQKDLDTALLAAYDHSLRYLLMCQGLIHPATIEGRNALIIEKKYK